MPITTDVAALDVAAPEGASQRPMTAYLAALAGGTGEFPDLIVVPVEPGDSGPVTDPALDELLPAGAAGALAALGLAGAAGEQALTLGTIPSAAGSGRAVTVLLLGVGDRSPAALRRAGGELGRRIAAGSTAVTSAVAAQDLAGVQAFAEGVLLGGYRFDLKSGERPQGRGLARLLLAAGADASAALDRATVLAGAVALARDLANTPSAVKTPEWLAAQAVAATDGRGVTARVWAPEDLAADGFGGILAVGSGSARPPRLIQLSYDPAGATGHTVLVGKGITFDSGGLSLKPNESMQAMKTDMSGGAVVIAVLAAAARLGLRHRVTGLVAAAENMPSGSSYRPGDVITHYGGTTAEVLNTDAEGRLVLADAIAYAVASLAPDQIIDIATLTGAARVALGTTHAALYASDDALAARMLAASAASGDRAWRMPLEDSYRAALDSDVADLCHVARDGNPAGSITAALFLREFAGGLPWAHLDIAGAGRSAEASGEVSKGATGWGVRLLLELLGN